MTGLIKNELMKIFSRKASWIYFIVILLVCILSAVIYRQVGPEPSKNWRADTKVENQKLKQELAKGPETDKEGIQRQIDQNQQYLDYNVNPNEKTTWKFMNSVVDSIVTLVTLFSVIICSGNVAAEFSDGTIKQLLIRPHRRWAILLSKYIAVTIYSLLLLLLLIASGYLVGLILYGGGGFSSKIFEMTLNGQKAVEGGPQFFLSMLYYLPGLFVIMTISFMLSTLFRSQSLAVGIGIFVLFLSSTLGGIIIMLAAKYEWAKFLIFPHLNLTIYLMQDKILGDVTLPMSLGILAVYYVIFIAVSFVFFQKKDVSI